MTQKYFFWTRG